MLLGALNRSFLLMVCLILGAAPVLSESAAPVLVYVETDTQTLSTGGHGGLRTWKAIHSAVCDHEPPIRAVLHVGDLVDQPVDGQYRTAEYAFEDRLDGCGVALHAAVGNHDYDTPDGIHPLQGLTRWFAWRAARPAQPERQQMTAQPSIFVSPLAAGWWVASLPNLWSAAEEAWLRNEIARLPPDAPVLFLHHSCAQPSGGQWKTGRMCTALLEALPRIRAVVSGHWLGPDRETFSMETLPSGREVISIYGNYQHTRKVEDGGLSRWGLLIELDPTSHTLSVKPYDPVTGKHSYTAAKQSYTPLPTLKSDDPASFEVPPLEATP